MVIEINKNIDNYKESVVLGLSARQLVYSVLSVVAGGGIVLLLYRHVGLTVSTYIAIPVVAPIAMTGFYSYHGMTFLEMMKLKMHFAFANRTYTYVSTEGEDAVRQFRQKEMQGKQNKAGSGKSREKNETDNDFDKAGFAKARRKMFRMLAMTALFILLCAGFAVWYKYR
ncbi:PrgI family protein [bacterium D16-51]|nr:PrgI family protein [bacterium D16-59]RKI60068.1 PrgI family protein [bacterium D16-51]